MVFSSLSFLVCFFVVAFVYYFSRETMRTIILFLFNTAFYLSFGLGGYITIFFIISFAYVIARLKKIHTLNIMIISAIMVLLFFKYVAQDFSFIVPVGVSFFTFKVIGYLMDVKSDKYEVETNYFHFYNYVLFFPQIVSGPIQRYDSFKMELGNLSKRIEYNQLRDGAVLFFFGLFEKIIISTRISIVVDYAFTYLDHMYGIYVIVAVLLYGMQLYTDFDGYSNIAIGLAKMLGIDTPSNFNVPYLAKNLSDFWRRWHISLSSWFKDYLYIPLGGNRGSKLVKYRNLMIVSVVSGVWHGNTMNFLTWGALHGIGQIIADIFRVNVTKKINNKYLKIILTMISIIVTYVFVNFAWIFFRLDFKDAIQCIQHMINFKGLVFNYSQMGMNLFDYKVLIMLVGIMVIVDIYRYFNNSVDKFTKLPFIIRWSVYFVVVFLFIALYQYDGGYVNNFIYGNF